MPEYIEREELLREFDELEPDEEYEYEHALWLDMRQEAIHTKAADVAPVVHGRWSKFYKSGNMVEEGFVSSCCDMWNERRSNFCPNCGAWMDGDGSDT